MDGNSDLGGFINDRYTERVRVINYLESFLCDKGNEEFAEIRQAYEATKSNETLEVYFDLLQTLARSKVVFAGFVVVRTHRSDYSLQIRFSSQVDERGGFRQKMSSQDVSCLNNHPNKMPDASSLSDVSHNVDTNTLDRDIVELQKRISTNNDFSENNNKINLSFVVAEKQRVFDLLATFFKREGNALKYDNLHDAYDIARTTESDVVYSLLLEKLYESSLDFPGFTLEDSFGSNGNAIQVVFDSAREGQSILHDIKPAVSPSNQRYESNEPFINLNKQILHYSNLETSTDIHPSSKKIDPNRNASSQVTNEFKGKVMKNIGFHDKRIVKLDEEIQTLREDIFRLKSETNRKAYDELDEEENLDNVKDSFSFIMVEPWSLPASAAYFIFIVQMVTFVLAVSDSILQTEDSDFERNPPLNLPKGVTSEVHLCQGITVFLIIIVQESLWESIADLFNGYNQHLKDQDIQFTWWLIPNLLRLMGGIVALIVTFILVIQSDSVIELLKDFTAMLFVSSFDNIIYFLASVNVIGFRFKTAVNKVEKITYKINEKHLIHQESVHASDFLKKCFVHPSSIGVFFLLILYTLWLTFVLAAHKRGSYLCQSIFVQLDDNVNPELSYYSGTYKLENGVFNFREDFFPIYHEQKKSVDGAKPMVFRYCKDPPKWIFAEKSKDSENECENDSALVESEDVELQAKYNVFEVSSDDWAVKYEDGRMMPLEDFKISCQDKEEKYTFDPETLCEVIEVDELTGSILTTRTWSREYKMLKNEDDSVLSVYNKPVYVGDAPSPNEGKDLIFFLGKRWSLISSNDLTDTDLDFKRPDDADKNLARYLKKEFHGKWSNYSVALFSEQVLVDTPQDTMMPDGLVWYEKKPSIKGEPQEVDENNPAPNSLICQLCNNQTNRCFYEGICSSSNKRCTCTKGSSGTLCQVPPTKNGLCDDFFNHHDYGFDGGDCCIHTCVSNRNFSCGMDKSNSFYVGYELCKNQGGKMWRKSNESPFVQRLLVTYISLSGNGRVIALIDSISRSVHVYDNDGSRWIMRGMAVTTVSSPESDSLSLSGNNFAIKTNDNLPSVILAVNNNSTVEVYKWDYNFWRKSSDGISKVSLTDVSQTEIHNDGKTLGILYENDSFKLFRRPENSGLWEEFISTSDTTHYIFFSMCEDGTKFVLANQTHVELYDNDEVVEIKSFSSEVKNVKISSSGQIVSVLVDYSGIKGYIHLYDISNNKFLKIQGILRGLNIDSQIDISNDGMKVTTQSNMDGRILFYEWKNKKWELSSESFFGQSVSMSTDKSAFAMISIKQSSNPSDSVAVYYQKAKCDNGQLLHITFVTDDYPGELTWEFSKMTSSGDEVLLKGGPYETEGTMVEEVCIENKVLNDECFSFTIIDLGLDGLKSPGKVGISVNGKMLFTRFSTNGYKHTYYPDLGNKACLRIQQEESPFQKKYDLFLHDYCIHFECTWNQTGIFNYQIPQMITNNFASISSDGLVLAIGDAEANNSTGQVQIFLYHEHRGWIKHGSDIVGQQKKDMFGSSVALSADGAILAVGASGSSVKDANSGLVRIYAYNTKNNDWSQLGKDIHGITSEAHAGFFVSLSADGKTVAISQLGLCSATVYKYKHKEDEWGQPVCVKVPETSLEQSPYESIAWLSSDGLVLAVSNPYAFETVGFVQVFEYYDFTKEWITRGDMFKGLGPENFLGYAVSMSSNGSTLAMAGTSIYPISIYEYKKTDKQYQQKGNENIFVKGIGLTDVALSSSGTVLVVAYQQTLSIFVFSYELNVWLGTTSKSIILNDDNYLMARTAVSADLTTVVGRTATGYNIYRLSPLTDEKSDCGGNIFNLTIQPDSFPEDITWYLSNEDGTIEADTQLLAADTQLLTNEESMKKNPEPLNFIRCLSKDSAFFTFVIEDLYGDGICCEWGDGSFTLEWNQEIILKSDNFKNYAAVCLPQSPEVSLFAVTMNFTMTEATETMFAVVNSSTTSNILESMLFQPKFSDIDQYQRCISNTFECLEFVVSDKSGNGVVFDVRINDVFVQELAKNFFVKKVKIGSNCGVEYCAKDYQMFELNFFTDTFPEEFSWELVDSKNATLAKSENYTNANSHYFYRDCFLLSTSECVILRLMDSYYDGGTVYAVSWNGVLIHDGIMTNDASYEVVVNGVTCI